MMSMVDVIVMETAASRYIWPMHSLDRKPLVRIMNASLVETPVNPNAQ